jgi:hypothetical protein
MHDDGFGAAAREPPVRAGNLPKRPTRDGIVTKA